MIKKIIKTFFKSTFSIPQVSKKFIRSVLCVLLLVVLEISLPILACAITYSISSNSWLTLLFTSIAAVISVRGGSKTIDMLADEDII